MGPFLMSEVPLQVEKEAEGDEATRTGKIGEARVLKPINVDSDIQVLVFFFIALEPRVE